MNSFRRLSPFNFGITVEGPLLKGCWSAEQTPAVLTCFNANGEIEGEQPDPGPDPETKMVKATLYSMFMERIFTILMPARSPVLAERIETENNFNYPGNVRRNGLTLSYISEGQIPGDHIYRIRPSMTLCSSKMICNICPMQSIDLVAEGIFRQPFEFPFAYRRTNLPLHLK